MTVELEEPSGEQTPKRLNPLSPFRYRNYSLLYVGQLISVLGDAAYTLALPWTVLATTGDPGKMALVLTIETVARTLSLMVGGALADRLSPRVIMLIADLGRAAVVGALAFTFFGGALPPLWLVAVLAGFQGVGSGLFMPGSVAMLPLTVSHDEVPAANGLMQVSAFLTMVIGPVLGGVATAAQAAVAFGLDAGSFLVSALSLALMRRMPRPAKAAEADAPAQSRGGLLGEMRDGLRYALSQPLLRATMSVTVVGNLAVAGVFGVALVVLSRRLDPSPVTLGLLLAGFGVGGIVGGLMASVMGRVRRRAAIALFTWAIMGFVLVAVPLVAGQAAGLPRDLLALDHQQRIYAVGGLLALAGLIVGLGDTIFIAVMQQKIPAEYMGRVFSLQLTAGSIAQPLSLLGAGALAATLGPGIVFIIGGVLITIAIIGAATSRELRTA